MSGASSPRLPHHGKAVAVRACGCRSRPAECVRRRNFSRPSLVLAAVSTLPAPAQKMRFQRCPHAGFVVDHQHSIHDVTPWVFSRGPSGKRSMKTGTRARPACSFNGPTVLLDDLAAHREAQPRTSRTRAEPGLENPRQILGGDSRVRCRRPQMEATSRPSRTLLRPDSSTHPPPGIARNALSTRFRKTCSRR